MVKDKHGGARERLGMPITLGVGGRCGDQTERRKGNRTKIRGSSDLTRTRTCEHAHIVVSGHVLLRPNSTKPRRYFRDLKLKEKTHRFLQAGGCCDSTETLGFAQHFKLYVASGEH